MKRPLHFYLLLLLLASPAGAQDMERLLTIALRPPTVPFTGKKLVVTWHGKQSHAAEVRVYFRPPSNWRHEVVTPQGKIKRVSIRNGLKEWVWLGDSNIISERDLAQAQKGRLETKDLENLLYENYRIISIEDRELLGHKTKGISLVPKEKAGSRRILWVDHETGIVLRRRQSNYSGDRVRESHFTTIKAGEDSPESFFFPDRTGKHAIVKVPDPRILRSLEEPGIGDFSNVAWISSLPFGHQLDSTSMIPKGGANLLHFRYTNGLSILSLFVSPHKIDTSRFSSQVTEQPEDIDFAGDTWAGNVLSWTQDKKHYLLVGDLSKRTLKKIQRTVRTYAKKSW